MSTLCIVMYHYVRDVCNTRYPGIKALGLDLFREQISYMKRACQIIGPYQLLDCLHSGESLPPQATLLTFDDGYLDHYVNVLPILEEHRISACFFPPAKCILERKILSVNKIQFVLSEVEDKRILVDSICRSIDSADPAMGLPPSHTLLETFCHPDQLDTANVVFIKAVLQRVLPEAFRDGIIDALFREFISSDEAAFSEELYMTHEQLECLHRQGMYIGSHGYGHYWLNTLSPPELELEIDRSLEFIRSIGTDTNSWIMCYPYGGYDMSVISLLRRKRCSLAVTTESRVALWDVDDRLALPRVDTIDVLPLHGKPGHSFFGGGAF